MNTTLHPDKFVNRHIGPSNQEIEQMLKICGTNSIGELISETIPAKIMLGRDLKLNPPQSENQFINELRVTASKNKVFKSYIGMGYNPVILPSVIQRNILENPGWYTQYTPYQAEIAQGRLEALINFQTLISELTAMDLANASLLDEGTAAAEAMAMFYSLRPKEKKEANQFFVSDECFPQTLDVIKTRANPLGIDLIIGNPATIELTDKMFGLLVQYPAGNGEIRDYTKLFSSADTKNIFKTVAADPFSLLLFKAPGEFGADAVVGSSQRFGIPMGYGGPHAAYFATKEKFKRNIPGRIIGASVDMNGNMAYRMALQTREQHIRRDKATSNICTAQVLLAIMAGMYAVYHGPNGLKSIALRIKYFTNILNSALKDVGYIQKNEHFFDTLLIETNEQRIHKIKTDSLNEMINLRYFDENKIGITINETTDENDLTELIKIFASAAGKSIDEKFLQDSFKNVKSIDIDFLKRESDYLAHPVFNSYHSETDLLRYMKYLENKDLSLAHSMIPLGSCTMKLNATTEMLGITWSEFCNIHPFTPTDQVKGYKQIFNELEKNLAEITGLNAVSLQPNSGAQGEFAGLMVIREYLNHKGESGRNVVLIPSSAHGTNPASAVMAGMKVVVVNCDSKGNIDINDLNEKAEANKDKLAALMITYPSTHGVFEENVVDICNTIHKYGGQVYMDGANMNAQVGLTNPSKIGADVCHLNLHKTFCIPHGGGGPGAGPIAVAEHLAPYLPGNPIVKIGSEKSITSISSAPWGSADILLISYAYIKLMGAVGLTESSKIAILNANYMMARLQNEFKVLYTGSKGRVAHELIFDMREFKQSANIEVEDIAKRLMDYGFHAPTVSFPVAGTLMIEPTESESKDEIDKYCDALISIRNEIREIENGKADVADNLLKNAPHTMQTIISDNWNHSYSRERAAYPILFTRKNKFWPSVGRVDSAYGDRHLVCSCIPVSEYADETF